MKKSNLRSIAIFCSAVITCASGWFCFKIPNQLLYFTFQNMFCILFAAIWGGSQGAAVTGLMLLAGSFGIPVFAHGGRHFSYFSTSTGGFLIGYFFAAILVGYVLKNPKQDEKTSFMKILCACVGGYFLIYIFGIVHFFEMKNIKITTAIFKQSYMLFKYYFLFDFVKAIVTSVLAYFLRPITAKYFFEVQQS